MQAIVTKFLGATNTRPARIKATAAAGSITIPYEYGLTEDNCHRAAALQLISKLGWQGDIVTGGLPDGSYCHVFSQALTESRATLKRRLSGEVLAGNPYIVHSKWMAAVERDLCIPAGSIDSNF